MNLSRFSSLAITLIALSVPMQATVLLSENFDELTAQLTVTSVGAFSAISGTNVDIVGAADGFGNLCAAPESGNCVDLGGSGGNPEGILQSNTAFALTPGVNYLLSFDLIGSQRGNTTSTTVTFGSYSKTFVLASGDDTDGIVNALVSVSSPGNYYLTFTNNTPGDVGSVLDNVSISTAASGVPEPVSLALIGGGLIALAGVRRLRSTHCGN